MSTENQRLWAIVELTDGKLVTGEVFYHLQLGGFLRVDIPAVGGGVQHTRLYNLRCVAVVHVVTEAISRDLALKFAKNDSIGEILEELRAVKLPERPAESGIIRPGGPINSRYAQERAETDDALMRHVAMEQEVRRTETITSAEDLAPEPKRDADISDNDRWF